MKQKEKIEIWNMIKSFRVLKEDMQRNYENWVNTSDVSHIKNLNDFDNLYSYAHDYFDAIEPEDTPHNFTPDVVNVESEIDSKSNRKSRLLLAHYSLSSLLVDVLDDLGDTIPHKQKLKQVISTYNKMLEDETKTGYTLAKDKELHFSQWQNLIKLGNNIFLKSIIDGKAHDFLSFLIAFNNDACKYEITDEKFDAENVDEQAKNELLDIKMLEKEKDFPVFFRKI